MFQNREDAGRQLGAWLRQQREWPGAVVLGLPRGGVPVAAEVARALGAGLEVFVVRKLGLPFAPEVAMGAVASGGAEWLNTRLLAELGLPASVATPVRERELAELARREARYGAGALDLEGRTALLVDDGLATGATLRAALRAVSGLGAAEVLAAVPVASPQAAAELWAEGHTLLALDSPARFQAVGQFYRDFRQTTHAEVLAALARHAADR